MGISPVARPPTAQDNRNIEEMHTGIHASNRIRTPYNVE
jgi:hypothetical protein